MFYYLYFHKKLRPYAQEAHDETSKCQQAALPDLYPSTFRVAVGEVLDHELEADVPQHASCDGVGDGLQHHAGKSLRVLVSIGPGGWGYPYGYPEGQRGGEHGHKHRDGLVVEARLDRRHGEGYALEDLVDSDEQRAKRDAIKISQLVLLCLVGWIERSETSYEANLCPICYWLIRSHLVEDESRSESSERASVALHAHREPNDDGVNGDGRLHGVHLESAAGVGILLQWEERFALEVVSVVSATAPTSASEALYKKASSLAFVSRLAAAHLQMGVAVAVHPLRLRLLRLGISAPVRDGGQQWLRSKAMKSEKRARS